MLLRLDTRAYVPNLILVNDLMPEIKNKDVAAILLRYCLFRATLGSMEKS